MVFNATFNNISVISWESVLLMEETGVPGENHRPVTDKLYHIAIYSMYSTFLIHKVTGWKHCDNVCYISPVWEHPNLPVTPTENGFRRLCDGTPCIPYNVLNKATQRKHCQKPPSPGINSCSFIWRWMQKWHIFLHYTNNRPRPFHCTELHKRILFYT